jgi:urea-proton symporter
VVVVVFGLVMGAFAILLFEVGLNLGWVYMFMGTLIGSAVCPLWNMMNWDKASAKGAIYAAWLGLIFAFIAWFVAAKAQSGTINVNTLGTNEAMLSGNVVAIVSSGIIHYVHSKFIDPQNYDFAELDAKLTLVEDDQRGLSAAERDPVELAKVERWVKNRGWALTIVLLVLWPILSLPQKVFSQGYFAFWVLISIGTSTRTSNIPRDSYLDV